MKKLLFALALCLGVWAGTSEAQAVGPVNPTKATWTAPTTNADAPIFSPLTDLQGYKVYLAKGATQPAFPGAAWSVIGTPASTTPAPAANTTVTFALPTGLTDGQSYLVVTAVDTVGNESAASNIAPFFVNRVAPGAASGLQMLP